MLLVTGIEETQSALLRLSEGGLSSPAVEAAAREFAGVVAARTPPGYSGKLPDSVTYEIREGTAVVGYEPGVDTAGGDENSSVIRPRTVGKTVIRRKDQGSSTRKRWVSADDLESVLQESLSDSFDQVMEAAERGVADAIA